MSRDGVGEAKRQALGQRKPSKSELAVDLLKSYKVILTLVTLGYFAGAYWLNILPKLDIRPVYKLVIITTVAGVVVGGKLVQGRVEPYLTDNRVPIAITAVDGRILDVIRIPRRSFGEFEILGKRFPERESLFGTKVLAARVVDFIDQRIVPAGDMPQDDRYPDDIDLIGGDEDVGKVMQYRNALLEDAERGRKATRDKAVLTEKGRNEMTMEFALAFEELRDNGLIESEKSDKELAEEAESVILNMAVADEASGSNE